LKEENQNETESEELDFTRPDFLFSPGQFHDYRQQGYYLICKSCEITHAVWIGQDRIMVGVDNKGVPILKNR
jgi:hypothetical protein